MIDWAYVMTARESAWERCSDQTFAEKDMSKLPFRLIAGCSLPLQEQRIWCQKHRRFEAVVSDSAEETVSDMKCTFSGPYVFLESLPEKIELWEPIEADASRWRVYQKEPTSPIVIAADIATLRFVRGPIIDNQPPQAQLIRIEWGVRSISLDVSNERFISYSMESQERRWPYRETRYEVPENIVNDIFPVLLQEAQSRYGIEPIADDPFNGFEKLKNFMICPLNRNVLVLKQFLPNKHMPSDVFNEMFPKNQRDYGGTICSLLDIDDPPEELKAACNKNIYAAFNYKLYRRFGFKDIKAIAMLWENAHCFGKAFDEFKFNEEDEKRLWCWWKNTSAYLAWALYQRNEVEVAELLRDTYYQHDERVVPEPMIDFYARYKKRLPKELIEQFRTEGFTFEVYEAMKKAEFNVSYRYVNLHVPELVENLECNINGYNFRLVRHTLYLRRISEALHSKLEKDYRRFIDHDRFIFTIDCQGQYVAFAEVAGKENYYMRRPCFEVKGLWGEFDAEVPVGIKLLCYYWAASHNFCGAQGFLKLSREERRLYRRTRYESKPLDPDSVVYDNYRLEELLDFPAYTRKDGYYPILENRLKAKSQVSKMSLPPWQSPKDEDSYLLLMLPWLEQILSDVHEGNPGAENFLGVLYGMDRYIPKDREREQYWLEQSAAQGYIPAMDNLVRAAMREGDEELGRTLAIRAAKKGSKAAFQWCIEHVSPAEYATTG